jgi:hypothetical protein
MFIKYKMCRKLEDNIKIYKIMYYQDKLKKINNIINVLTIL